ncbi:MAG: hypothetical protein COS34_09480 [Lysobacterales bacterium CG02_land_8_20_14_3_00_62_12]|nr:MAG: hypothetical protein COS34_09480 [Xanthomonadales bacterium CG02_land_8_20_14_3_00_62_12]
MTKPPLIRKLKVVAPAQLEIVWSSGETLCVDVSRLLARYKLYAPLKDPVTFRKAKLDDWGHAVIWPGNIDMGADTLYERAREQAGAWGPEAFADWMQLHGLSLNGAADALGMTRRMMSHYRSGSRPIPRVVMLACQGWESHNRQRAA